MAKKKKKIKITIDKIENPHSLSRKTWGFNPVTRVKQSKKRYNRKNKSWKKDL
jgi:hypothetical protein